MISLPTPRPGRSEAERFVADQLARLFTGPVASSSRFRGGQSAADAALAQFEVAGYARRRNQVLPVADRGASMLSPWIRHGLLSLRLVWDHVDDGPRADVRKYRDELLWQEYARHAYARLGSRTGQGLRREQLRSTTDRWPTDLACIEAVVAELEADGWMVNQARMWFASHWTIRSGRWWRDGEDLFFRHLLDGSRAANRLGWQWTLGLGSAKPYGFSRWQVEKRAPELCRSCPLAADCPIEDWPDEPSTTEPDRPVSDRLARDDDPDATAGPAEPTSIGDPASVWLTAESLGHDDPALFAHPDLPAIFVFDEPLLAGLGLSAKRLVFLVETLAELAAERPLELWRGDPAAVLEARAPAVTFAPVPGFRRLAGEIQPAVVHPYQWLLRPNGSTIRSFSAWRRSHRA